MFASKDSMVCKYKNVKSLLSFIKIFKSYIIYNNNSLCVMHKIKTSPL